MSAVVTAKLTSTTAPGKTFASRSELADHYKSDWHKYNLKRREASLPLLEEQEFQARWEAAIALRQEKEKKNGTDHLKTANRNNNGKKQHKKRQNEPSPRTSRGAEGRGDKEEEDLPAGGRGDDDVTMEEQKGGSGLVAESQETPEIDPKQSLFDSHRSGSLDDNVAYMQRKYGFFIPDQGKCPSNGLTMLLSGMAILTSNTLPFSRFATVLRRMFDGSRGAFGLPS